MAKFTFKTIQFSKPNSLGEASYLWVWNPDRIPPHLGFSTGKNYYSLTYKANEIKSVSGMIGKANRLKIPLLLIEITESSIKTDAAKVFQQFEKAIPGVNTCLTPIREVLGMDETIQQLANLLTELEKQNNTLAVFALHLTETYRELPEYAVSDIVSRIQELNHAKR